MKNRTILSYWAAHYSEDGVCTLCDNKGIICCSVSQGERKDFCFCPRGNELRFSGASLEEWLRYGGKNPLQAALEPMRQELKDMEELGSLEDECEGADGCGKTLAAKIESHRAILDYVDQATEPIVPAECHSDDFTFEIEFDAALFLFHNPEAIADLAEGGWSGYPSDGVAIFMEDHDPKIKAMFNHIHAARKAPGLEVGFACRVNEEAARKWVALIRPDIDQSEKE